MRKFIELNENVIVAARIAVYTAANNAKTLLTLLGLMNEMGQQLVLHLRVEHVQ